MVHPMIQAAAANGQQGQGGNPYGGGAAGSQEEEHPLHREDSQEAVHLQEIPHRSRQEEQDLQAALHSHLQGYLNPIAIQTHGLHWTDLGSLYRS